ncbi:MAG: HAD family hydrolase [Chthoniobacteraceae bacterium]
MPYGLGPVQKTLFLFDIDGTLLASGGAGIRALELTTAEIFGDADISDIDIAGRTDLAITHQIFALHGRDPEPAAVTVFSDCYLSHLSRMLPIVEGRLLPGIIELLEALKARPDCVVALLTGNLERGAKLKLTHFGLWQYFEFGAYADDHHDRNELGPVARRRAVECHGTEFPPERIFVLGDTPHDISCARAIDARAVAIATGRHSREILAEYQPDFLFDDLSDVPAVLAVLR